jgi:hypothetical protein
MHRNRLHDYLTRDMAGPTGISCTPYFGSAHAEACQSLIPQLSGAEILAAFSLP